jgi:hypothetical protein
VQRCSPVVEFVSVVRIPPSWTWPAVVRTRPVTFDVQDQCADDGPAGTAYSDVRQLFMSSHSGRTGRIPPAAAGDQRTLTRKYTVFGSALWFMMWNRPLQLPESA